MENKFEKAYFKTNVLLKNIIGKELINDDNVAVMELVKNSYDAGASRVDIIFNNLFNGSEDKLEVINEVTNKTSRIVIQDNGVGMSKDDILYKWLNIAYSSKKVEHTQNKRFQAGNKGVGRFSCDRLGEFLNLYTREEESKIIHLQISWKDFELINKRDIQIQDVPVNIREIENEIFKKESGFKLFTKGTIIEILKLNSIWAELEDNSLFPKIQKAKLLKLKNSIERLINPNQSYEKNSFKVFISAKELEESKELKYHERVTGEVQNQIFNELDFKTTNIESIITEDGSKIITELKDKDKTIFRVIEKNVEFPLLKNIKIVLYYLNPYAKAYFKRKTGRRSVAFGSIFLFINGFRISPYGDTDNDWLGLEQRKVQGVRRYLSGREILGRIEIQDFNNEYRVISSREGIVHGKAYKQLVSDFTKSKFSKYNGFYFKIHKRLEKYVVDGLEWDSSEIEESEIEKLVEQSDWNESKEEYSKDIQSKLYSSSEMIYSILGIKSKEVVDLYINEELIENLIEENSEKTNEKLQKFLKNYSNLPSNVFDEKTKKAITLLSKNIQENDTIDNELSKKFEETVKEKRKVEKELKEQKKTQQELYKLFKKKTREQKKKAREEKKILEEENQKLKKQKEQKEKQILFLQSLQTLDAEQLINLQHHIGLYAHDIEGILISFKKKYNKNKILNEENVFELLQRITLSNKKILTINKLATKANFLTDSEEMEADLVNFIYEYINNIYLIEDSNKVDIKVTHNNIEYKTLFSPFEFTIILDNLIQNSKKVNKPKKILINIDLVVLDDKLRIEFYDNGKGLNKSIDNASEVFSQGFTTTNGSGLGLYHVKQMLNKYNFDISIDKEYTSGFKLVIQKQ